jgi:peptidoglycan/xylan/chitin deacetylase (PgdA/CDA1 family)
MTSDDTPAVCLTLDLEEDWSIPNAPDRNPTFDRLDDYIAMVSGLDVPVSVFAVGRTIERHPEVVDRLRTELETEFHVHSYQHDMTRSYDFPTEARASIEAYESFFGEPPAGYRAPQGNIVPEEWVELERAGFEFDASVFPSYRPGVYNNLDAPLTPYVPDVTDDLLEIPFAAVPWLRIPVSMNYLKLLGSPFLWTVKKVPLPDPLVFDSHLQDYWRTEFHEHLPSPKRRLMTRNIDRAPEMFVDFMRFLDAEGYEFTTMSEVYRRYA